MSSFPSTALSNINTDDISGYFSSNIIVHVLRLDKIHAAVSGNKWFKLYPYLELARNTNKKGLITFGGAWSNHILATAVACQFEGLRSIGLIRGEAAEKKSSTLIKAQEAGMKLYFLSREDYRKKIIPADLDQEDLLLVNEGGYGKPGAKGAARILDYSAKTYTHYCCAVGTGTMLAGLVGASTHDQHLIGISVMKNNIALEKDIAALLEKNPGNWTIRHEYHFGGYAKHPPELIAFINKFYSDTAIPSDIVYTGKLFYAMKDLADKGFFKPESRILVIHSGGLQGNDSVPKGTLMF